MPTKGAPAVRAPLVLRSRTSTNRLAVRSHVLGTVTVNENEAAHLVALSTAPTEAVGRRIITSLVERRLIACGTLIPGAVSIYRWDGAVQEEREVVLILKTTAGRWNELREVYASLHPYEVPELIAWPIVAGHAPYLEWLSAET